MKPLIFAIALLGVTTFGTVHANETQTLYNGNQGVVYHITYNTHGAVLRSSSDVIYLGNNCDAKSSKYGAGKWWWANGGWGIDFNNGKVLASEAHAESPSVPNRLNCDN